MARQKRPSRTRPAEPARTTPPEPAPLAPQLIPQKALPWLWHLAAAVSFWLLQFKVNLNSDLWFHLAAGRLIWQEKAIPAVDAWSFTAAGRPWQNHEWLADVFFYLWSQAFGVDSLVIWQWLVVGVAYLLLFRLLRRVAGSYAMAWLLSMLALAVGTPFYEIRPHLWTVLFFVLLILWTWERDRPPLALPALFVVWINLHGGAVFGLMALFVTLGCQVLFGEKPWRKRFAFPAGMWGACVLATLLNPYGWRAIAYPLRLASAGRSATRTLLSEWLPPFEPGGLRAPLYPAAIGVFAVAAAILILLLVRNPPQRRRNLAALGLGLLTLAMSLASRRFVPFFGIAATLAEAQAWLAIVPRLTGPRRSASPRPWRLAAPAVPAVVALIAGWRLAAYPLGPAAFDPLTWTSRLPIDSVDFMEANGLKGDLFVYYLWGGYVHWRTAGDLRVHFDTRSETVFPDATILQHQHVATLAWDAESIVDRSGAQYVLWPMNSPAFRGLVQKLVQSRRWWPIYRDGVSMLLVRSDVQLPGELRPTPDSGYHWWAVGRQAMDEQRLDDAASALEQALTADPRLWPACQELALVRSAQGDRAATLQTVDRCRAIFPDLQLDADELLKRGRR